MRRPMWQRWLAPACLALGVLSLFVAGGIALALREWDHSVQVTVVLGLALVLAAAVIDHTALLALVSRRQARFGTLSVLVTAVVVGIVALANVALAASPAEVDLTRAGLFSLSPESVQATQRLSSTLLVTGFFRPQDKTYRESAQALLSLYQEKSPNLKVRYLDPDQNVVEAKRFGVDISGDLVLEYQGRPPVILTLASQTESDITGALIRLESSRTPQVCWAQGDGERSLQSQDQQVGYSAVHELLSQRNYATRDILLSQTAQIPSACAVVAVIGPQSALSPMGQKALADYLAGGGKLLLAYGPWLNAAVTQSVNAPLGAYGLAFSSGLVVEGDPNHYAQNDPTTLAVYSWATSPITRTLNGSTGLFPHPTSIESSVGGNVTAVEVGTSTPSSYLIRQPRSSTDLGRQGSDAGGPFTIMESFETAAGQGRSTRIVLIGTADVGENLALTTGGVSNQDLMLGTFDWLSQQEAVIAISAKPAQAQQVTLTQSELTVQAIIALVLVPGLILLLGAAVLLRRRAASAAT
ncbi:MAG: GldG family protein [Candidatus Dormibacteraeota bacterium]|nr:GldG family protein [Candidatus Dormibacteraeota bacterium]